MLTAKNVGGSASPDAGKLVCDSRAMQVLMAALEGVAAEGTPILLEGEHGTGKRLVAHYLHGGRDNPKAPFLLADTREGAPIDALLKRAADGTLVLTNIEELSLDLQAGLAKIIETFWSNDGRARGPRLVCVTSSSLAEAVRRGRFREDLYYRLATTKIRLPSLRERKEDIRTLVRIFAEDLGANLSPEMENELARREWPGNARQLRNAVAVLAGMPMEMLVGAPAPTTKRDIDPRIIDEAGLLRPLPEARRLYRQQFERSYTAAALVRARGHVPAAAALAGVSRQFLSRLVRRYRLR